MRNTTHPTPEGIGGAERARPELLDVRDVAALMRCSTRHVYRLADGGRMPQPVRIGALVRWSRRAVLDWIAAGCPSLRTKGGVR